MREVALAYGGRRLADLLAPIGEATMQCMLRSLSRSLDVASALSRFADAVRGGADYRTAGDLLAALLNEAIADGGDAPGLVETVRR